MARILVVDDDPQVVTVFRKVLEDAGHETAGESDGKAAIKAFRTCPVDLVITDIFMPESDGLEVVRALREVSDRVKILAISGGGPYGTDKYLDVAECLGADAALEKVVDADTLLCTVNSLLGR